MTVEEMVKRLGLSPRLEKQAGICRVTDAEARKMLGIGTSATKGRTPGDFSGTAFLGHDLRGAKRGVYQVRRDNPDIVNGKEQNKWMSPKGSDNRYLNTTPGKLQPKDTVVIVESPKSVWAITASAERVGRKHIKVLDTNGLDGWKIRDEKDQPSHPNPDLMFLKDHDGVVIPDSNAQRPDLAYKVTSLQTHLLEVVGVSSLRTARLPETVNGPDDFVSEYGDTKFWELYDAARPAWMEAFPPAQDFAGLELKADLLIPHLIANRAITIVASPSENYKTMWAMEICRSLLTGEPACEYFEVEQEVKSVVYCCPDMSFELLMKYVRPFGLDQRPGFHIRTMKQGEILGPDHPYVKAAARDGSYVVFDTMNYFTGADDDNNPQQLNKFIVKVRHLVDFCNSPGCMVLAHPTKTGVNSSEINITEWVSGTYAKIGTVDTIFCLKKLLLEDGVTPASVYISREKSRPFLGVRLDPFTLGLADGEGSLLDRGRFPVRMRPGTVPALRDLLPGKNKGGAPEDPEKEKIVKFMKDLLKAPEHVRRRPSGSTMARHVDKTFPKIPPRNEKTIRTWMKEIANDEKTIKQIQTEGEG
jgi:hypothetical protein